MLGITDEALLGNGNTTQTSQQSLGNPDQAEGQNEELENDPNQNQEISKEESNAPSPKKKKAGPKLLINIFNTQYPVIQEAAKNLNFKIREPDPNLYINPYLQMDQQSVAPQVQEFDICWFDLAIQPDILYRIKAYQRISQVPGINVIAHKNKLGKNLMMMLKHFPEDYNFFPETYLLPYELYEFRNLFKPKEEVSHEEGGNTKGGKDKNDQTQKKQIKKNMNDSEQKVNGGSTTDATNVKETAREQKASHTVKKVNKKNSSSKCVEPQEKPQEKPLFIVKPECQSQGKGIFLTRAWEDINPHDHVVAQRYIDNPYLIDGLKFDLRIYVLLYGVNPLRVYIFDEGIARFATAKYEHPTYRNQNNMFMHLTNYAINKNATNYQQNENEEGTGKSHKRSLKQIYKFMEMRGVDTEAIIDSIDDLVVKTMITAQPSLWQVYRSCQPEDVENQLCFQILGFDVMIDEHLKPWLIEVNHAPSLATESVFDMFLKKKLVEDTIRLLNLTMKRKMNYINNQRICFQKRILTGKTTKLTQEEKDQKRLEIDKQRSAWESKLLGGYRMIYPVDQAEKAEKYRKMIEVAKMNYEEQVNNGRRNERFQKAKPDNDNQNNNNNNAKGDGRPPWRSTGVAALPTYDKGSKLPQFQNIKAKVQTGLGTLNSGERMEKSVIGKQILSMQNLQNTDDGDGNEAPHTQYGSTMEQTHHELHQQPQEYHLDENGNLIYNQLEPEDSKRTLYQHMIINCNNDQKIKILGQQQHRQQYQQQYNYSNINSLNLIQGQQMGQAHIMQPPLLTNGQSSPYNQSYYNKFNLSLQNGINGINGFGYNVANLGPTHFPVSQSMGQQPYNHRKIVNMSSGNSQPPSNPGSPQNANTIGKQASNLQVFHYIQNQHLQQQQNLQNYLSKNDQLKLLKGSKMGNGLVIGGPGFDKNYELFQMNQTGGMQRTNKSSNMNMTQPNFSHMLGADAGIAGISLTNNHTASTSKKLGPMPNTMPNSSLEHSHKSQLNLENILNPDNPIRSNSLYKNGVQVKNHLGLPVKSQLYELNTNNLGATTNATTAATNGTVSGQSGEDSNQRNFEKGKSFNQKSTLMKSSNESSTQFQIQGQDKLPPNQQQNYLLQKKTGKDVKSQTFYKQQNYQDILKTSGEQQLQGGQPYNQLPIIGNRNSTQHDNPLHHQSAPPQYEQNQQQQHQASSNSVISNIHSYIIKQTLAKNNDRNKMTIANETKKQIFDWQMMVQAQGISPGANFKQDQSAGSNSRPQVQKRKSGGFFQSSTEPKSQKKKEPRGTIHFNNINLNSTANIKAPLGSKSTHHRNQTLPPNPQLNLVAVAQQKYEAGSPATLNQPSTQGTHESHSKDYNNSRSGDRQFITLGQMQNSQMDLLKQIEKNQEIIHTQLNQMHKIENRYHNTPIISKNNQNKIIAQQLVTNIQHQIQQQDNNVLNAQMADQTYLSNINQMAIAHHLKSANLQNHLNGQTQGQNHNINPSPGHGATKLLNALPSSIAALQQQQTQQPPSNNPMLIAHSNPHAGKSPGGVRGPAIVNQRAFLQYQKSKKHGTIKHQSIMNSQGLYLVANEDEEEVLNNLMLADTMIGPNFNTAGNHPAGQMANNTEDGTQSGGKRDAHTDSSIQKQLSSQLGQYHPLPLNGINAIQQTSNQQNQPSTKLPIGKQHTEPPHQSQQSPIRNTSGLDTSKPKQKVVNGAQRLLMKQNQEKAALLEKQQAHQNSLGINLTTTSLQPVLPTTISSANAQYVQNALNQYYTAK